MLHVYGNIIKLHYIHTYMHAVVNLVERHRPQKWRGDPVHFEVSDSLTL